MLKSKILLQNTFFFLFLTSFNLILRLAFIFACYIIEAIKEISSIYVLNQAKVFFISRTLTKVTDTKVPFNKI